MEFMAIQSLLHNQLVNSKIRELQSPFGPWFWNYFFSAFFALAAGAGVAAAVFLLLLVLAAFAALASTDAGAVSRNTALTLPSCPGREVTWA